MLRNHIGMTNRRDDDYICCLLFYIFICGISRDSLVFFQTLIEKHQVREVVRTRKKINIIHIR